MIRTIIIALGAMLLTTGLAAEDAALQAGFGAKVFAENCNRCHEAPDPTARDGRAWRSVALHMRVFADISKQDQDRLIAFLRTFNTVPKP